MATPNAIEVNRKELGDFYDDIRRMERRMSRKEINDIQTRHAQPMLNDMKRNAPFFKFASVTKITVRQTKPPTAPPIGIRIGVINNDESKFPDFSAPAMASVFEHGTAERFRQLVRAGFVTGHQSTGKIKARPWLRPAWDRNKRSFMQRVERAYIKKVER